MAGHHRPTRTSSSSSVSSSNVVGVHYKVGRKIGEGSFGIIYEGSFFFCNLLANKLTTVCIKVST
jgi:casein kinase 1